MSEFIMKANGTEIEKLTWRVDGFRAEVYSSSLGQLFGDCATRYHEAKSAYINRIAECKEIGKQMSALGMAVEYSEM